VPELRAKDGDGSILTLDPGRSVIAAGDTTGGGDQREFLPAIVGPTLQ